MKLDSVRVIALLPENREQVSAAGAKLLERGEPAKEEKASMSFDAIVIGASRQGIQAPRV